MTICRSCGAGVRKRIRCRHKPCGMMVCDYCLHESHQKHMLGAPVYPESGGVSDVRCIELSERMNARTAPADVHVTCCACVVAANGYRSVALPGTVQCNCCTLYFMKKGIGPHIKVCKGESML